MNFILGFVVKNGALSQYSAEDHWSGTFQYSFLILQEGNGALEMKWCIQGHPVD